MVGRLIARFFSYTMCAAWAPRAEALDLPEESAMDDRVVSDPQTWVDRHGDYLFRCALLRVRDHEVAEELVQETFLAALQAKDRFAGQSSERTWMVGILQHKIIDRFRQQTRERPAEDPERLGEEFEDAGRFDEAGHWKTDAHGPQDWANPTAALEQRQFWDVLRRCLSELPPRMAQAYALREVDEMTSEEVCETMQLTRSNLWVILHRVRKHLRQCLEQHHFRPEPT